MMENSKDCRELSDTVQNRFTAYVQTALRNRRIRYLSNPADKFMKQTISLPDNFNMLDRGESILSEEATVLDILKGIQEKEREIVYMKTVYEMTFKEIAEKFGTNQSSVSMVYYRALEKLKRHMTKI